MNTKILLSLTLAIAVSAQGAKEPTAPKTLKSGEMTAKDAFQWIEEPKTADTSAWMARLAIDAESKGKTEMAKRIGDMVRAESLSNPCVQDGHYFFTKRAAGEKQASIYFRKGFEGSDERLVDAAKVKGRGNAALRIADVSEDGSLLVYVVRAGKTDEGIVRIFDVNAGRDLPDVLPHAHYNTISVAPEKKGVYYTKVEPAGTRVFFHPFGGETTADKLVFGEMFNYEPLGPKDAIAAEVTDNGRYLILSVARGQPVKRVDVYSQELDRPDRKIRPIIHSGLDDHFSVVNHEGDLFVLTDNEAPKKRVVKISIDDPAPPQWKTIVPEGGNVISDISIVGGRLFVSGPQEGATQTRIFTLEGKEVGQITYPAIGTPMSVHHKCPRP